MSEFSYLKLHMGMGIRNLVRKMTGIGQKDCRICHLWKMPNSILIEWGRYLRDLVGPHPLPDVLPYILPAVLVEISTALTNGN